MHEARRPRTGSDRRKRLDAYCVRPTQTKSLSHGDRTRVLRFDRPAVRSRDRSRLSDSWALLFVWWAIEVLQRARAGEGRARRAFALGGVLLGLAEHAGWEMGTKLLLLMFAGVTLGGLGTAYGALLGSLLVGIFLQMSTMVIPPELKTVGALALLILALIFRPQGLLGQRERIG